MPELTLQRVGPGLYALGDVGTLRSRRRFAAEIEADGTTWSLRRGRPASGHLVTATELSTRLRVARYVPSGFLHLRGIYRGTIHLGDRELEWQGDHHMASHFTVRESGDALAEFEAGSEAQPVSVALFGLRHLDPLPLLFCCHIVKRVVDITMQAGSPGAPAAPSGG